MPRFTYLGNQNFIIAKQSVRKTKLGLLAAGSGLTPIYQIVNAMHLAKDKTVEVKMIYSNKSEEDILMKQQLDTINGGPKTPKPLERTNCNLKIRKKRLGS